MDLLTDLTAVSSMPAVPSFPEGAVRGYFAELAPGVAATSLRGWWFNMVSQELVNLIQAANLSPSPNLTTQVAQALRRLAGSNLTSVTSNTTLTPDNAGIVEVWADSGDVVINLPQASACLTPNGVSGFWYKIIRRDNTAYAVTINFYSGDSTWSGATSINLGPLGKAELWASGTTNWDCFVSGSPVGGAAMSARSATNITFGAGYSGAVQVSFRAPCKGTVDCASGLTQYSQGAAGVVSQLGVNVNSSGWNYVDSDTSELGFSSLGTWSVDGGESVVVQNLVTASGNTGIQGTYRVSARFFAAGEI